MSRSVLGRLYCSIAFVVYCFVVASIIAFSASAARAQAATDINDAVNNLAGFKPKKISIAPMVKKGVPVPGEWTNATPYTYEDGSTAGSLWIYLLSRSGISDNPLALENLSGRPGFLALIKDSEVVLPGGSRATFGWFVKMESDSGATKDFFILMSYDLRANFKGPSQAFEVFVFTAGHSSVDNAQLSTVVGGFAVQFNGNLLNEVPLTIADQRFNQNPGVAVTPGVTNGGQGCLACHSHNLDDLPQGTTPFPWTGNFYPTPEMTAPATPTATSTSTTSTPSSAAPSPASASTSSSAATQPSSSTPTSATTPVIAIPVAPSTSERTDRRDDERRDDDRRDNASTTPTTTTPSKSVERQDAAGSTPTNVDRPKSSAIAPPKADNPEKSSSTAATPAPTKQIEKQDAAVGRTIDKPDQPKSSALAPKGERLKDETSRLDTGKAMSGAKSVTGEKPATGNATKSKSARRTASSSKPAKKKKEDKVEVHIEFFSSKGGSGSSSFNSGGFGR